MPIHPQGSIFEDGRFQYRILYNMISESEIETREKYKKKGLSANWIRLHNKLL